MTDRIHPSTTTTLPPPPSKRLPIPLRQHPAIVEPQPYIRRRSLTDRRNLCLICLWSTVLILAVALLAAGVAIALFFVYRPHHPQFSPTSLKMSSFNLSTASSDGTTRLTTNFNLTISSKNPNAKVTFFYDPVVVTLFSPSYVLLSNGSFPGFNSTPSAISVLHATTSLTSQLLDTESVKSLRADLRRIGLPVKIVMDTRVRVNKIMSKVGIRVECGGIHGMFPRGKRVISSDISKAKCKVDIKILKLTF